MTWFQFTLDAFMRSLVVWRMGVVLLYSLWQAALIAVLLWVALLSLRRRSPKVRYATACAAMAFVFASPIATFYCVRDALPANPSSAAVSVVSAAQVAPTLMPHASNGSSKGPIASALQSAFDDQSPLEPNSGLSIAPIATRPISTGWLAMVVLGWAGGVLTLATWNFGGWISVGRLRTLGAEPVGDELAGRVLRVARSLGLTKTVRVISTMRVEVPAVIGWIRPVLLLPVSVTSGLPSPQLDAILAHELAHILRYDYLTNLLQCIVETLLFYHPAVWWISARIRLERELCCDDVAVAACGDRVTYADSLAAIAEGRPPGFVALAAGGRRPEGMLLGRIRRLLKPGSAEALIRPRPVAGAALAAFGVAAVILCITAMPDRATADDKPSATSPATRHMVRGTVITPDGKSAVGVRATLVVPDGLAGQRRAVATSVTNNNGEFAIAVPDGVDIPGEDSNVMVEPEGSGICAARILPSARPDDAGEFMLMPIRLRPASTLRVEFLGPDGAPVSGMKVTLSSVRDLRSGYLPSSSLVLPVDAQERLAVRTDAEGFCTIAGLPQQSSALLHIEDDRFGQLGYRDNVIIGPESAASSGPIHLRPAGSITGRLVYDGTDKSVAHVAVIAQAADRRQQTGWGSATTDQRGQFEIKQLLAGTYHVHAVLDAETQKSWVPTYEDVSVLVGEHKEAAVLKLIKGGIITGKLILKDTGAGVPNLYVGLIDSSRPPTQALLQSTRTRPDGSFFFRARPGPQRLYLQQSPPDGYLETHQNLETEVKIGQTARLTIELPRDPSPPVSGKVVDEAGNPVAGATVTAMSVVESHSYQRSTQTDQNGEFHLLAVAPKSEIRVRKGDLGTIAPVTTLGGENDLTLHVQHGAVTSVLVTVKALDKPVRGAQLFLMVWHGSTGMRPGDPVGETDANGQCVLEGLDVDGKYYLSAKASNPGSELTLRPGHQATANFYFNEPYRPN